jgi:predicted transcriptional regulator
MRKPRLSKLELQIMDVLWRKGPSAIRDIQENLPTARRPAYTTVQTMVYRLEAKKVLTRTAKVGNAHLFAAVVTRDAATAGLVDDFLALFGGRMQPAMARLIEAGNLSEDDIAEAERLLRDLPRKRKKP